MDPAIQDYLNNVQESESLKSAIEGKLQLKQERISQILSAFEQLGLPAGLEGLQSLKEYAIKNSNKFLSDEINDQTQNNGEEDSGILDTLKSFVPNDEKINDIFNSVKDQIGNKVNNILDPTKKNFLDNIKLEINKNVAKNMNQEGEDGEDGIVNILKRQVASRLPLKQSIEKLNSIKNNVTQIKDGDLINPENRIGSLTALTRQDLNNRLPTGRNFQEDINNLTGTARSQYLRILEGDPSEMGSLLPEHLFDHAQFVSQQYRDLGVINPEELAPVLKKNISDVLNSIPKAFSKKMAKFTESGEQTTQPATTSDNIANLMSKSIIQQSNNNSEEKEIEARNMLNPKQDNILEGGTEMKQIGLQEDNNNDNDENNIKKQIEGDATTEETATGSTTGKALGETVGETEGETIGETAGEAVGESLAADALGPIGAIVGLGSLIASLVESFKKENLPNLSVPVLQAGTD